MRAASVERYVTASFAILLAACGGTPPASALGNAQTAPTAIVMPSPTQAPTQAPPPATSPPPRAPDVSAAPRTSHDAPVYTLADLQALEKTHSWAELLDHARDITPSNRNDTWTALLERAAAAFVEQRAASDADDGLSLSEQLVNAYPQLTASAPFMTKRAVAAKAFAERCLTEAYGAESCLATISGVLKTEGTDATLGFELAKITRRHTHAQVAIPFFEWAFKKRANTAWCADEDVRLSVVAALGLPPTYADASSARRVASVCWAQLKEPIEREAALDSSSYRRDNTSQIVKPSK